MKIRLKKDSRDSHAYQKFGQTTDFDLVNYDDPNIPEKVQPPGNIECVLYTATYIAQNKTKKEYDIDELFSRVPHYPSGTDVREVFGEIINVGLQIKGTNIYEKPFSSYWRADTGNFDAFDNARSAMKLVGSPIAIASFWHREWLNLGPYAVMPVGKTPLSGHMYANKGLGLATPVTINNEPMFIIEWWGGFTMFMPRETFNEAMKSYGMSAWVLSDSEIDAKVRKTLMQKIVDVCINTILLMRQLLILKKVPVAEPVKIEPQTAYQEVKQAITMPKYLWETPDHAKHSVRVICDEEKLDLEQKNTMCATIGGESGWDIHAKKLNYAFKNGKKYLASTDIGICQWNDYYHSKEITPDEAENNPEKAVRLMCAYWKRGQRDTWIAYKNGSYKKYL